MLSSCPQHGARRARELAGDVVFLRLGTAGAKSAALWEWLRHSVDAVRAHPDLPSPFGDSETLQSLLQVRPGCVEREPRWSPARGAVCTSQASHA
jgi:hypothetical protein